MPYTLPGETIEVESVPGHPDRRHLLRVETASPERIEPFCPYFGICGGCAIQHWVPARYREWKRSQVVAALSQAGLDSPVEELIDAHGEGRRRATFHASRGTRDISEVGFAALRTHHIVGIDRCPVLAPSLDGAIAAAWAVAEALEPQKKPLDIPATATDAGIDMDVRGSGPLNSARIGVMARLAATHKLARLTRHGELIAQRAAHQVAIGRARLTPCRPVRSCRRPRRAKQALARLVDDHVGSAKLVADLFCGVGPFALRLAERARIVAFDADAGAIAALKQATATTQGLKPVDAEVRDLFRRPLIAQELKRVDAVVFDPPRQGAEAQARELASSAVPIVVAVSCNPATFARDARILVDGGYKLTSATPVDQFRHSAHVEIVALLTR